MQSSRVLQGMMHLSMLNNRNGLERGLIGMANEEMALLASALLLPDGRGCLEL
jgi:hypothetical protein